MPKTDQKDVALDFSVVICTYNGALRLPKLLDRLQQQQAGCRWEVLVVDNNSGDRTSDVVKAHQRHWRSDVSFRYCFEPEQGLAFARRCAIRQTSGNLIGFLDDDTLPEAGWVEQAVLFGQAHPQAGAYGSTIKGLYEVPPPPDFHRIACCLAIIERGGTPFQYAPERGVLPAGAGMVVRRQAWLEQVPEVPALAGVKAGSLKAKGEDVETLSYIRRTWEIWHNPAMRLGHLIGRSRLSREYLTGLFWHIGLSRYPLRKIQHAGWKWPLMVALYAANDARKVGVYLWKWICRKWVCRKWICQQRPRRANAGTQATALFTTVETCELSLLLSSFLSPLFAIGRFAVGPFTLERVLDVIGRARSPRQLTGRSVGRESL